MSDVWCPYCGYAQDICHDDGYGYEEDRQHEQECPECEKEFVFTTAISFHYTTYCQPGEHDVVPVERHPGYVKCSRENCDHFAAAPQPGES